MTGLLLLFAVAIIAMIIFWSIINDRVGPDERTTGLLAMRDEGPSNERSEDADKAGATGQARPRDPSR